jgi:hypothetical protein
MCHDHLIFLDLKNELALKKKHLLSLWMYDNDLEAEINFSNLEMLPLETLCMNTNIKKILGIQ